MAEIAIAATAAAAATVGSSAAVGVAASAASPTHRQCTFEIKNECENFNLCHPRIYIESGNCAVPLPPYIASSGCGVAQFSKTPHTACGSVGVFTYDLQKNDTEQTTERIAVMFSVPYDFNLYSNWFAVGIFEKSKECDRNLYNDMYYRTEKSFVRGEAKGHSLNYKSDHVQIMATMSDSFQPIIKMHVMNRATKM